METNPQCPPVTADFLTHFFGSVETAVIAIDFLLNQTDIEGPRAILLTGVPLSGKTLFAKWLLKQTDNGVTINGHDTFSSLFNGIERACKQLVVCEELPRGDAREQLIAELGATSMVVKQKYKANATMRVPHRYLLISNSLEGTEAYHPYMYLGVNLPIPLKLDYQGEWVTMLFKELDRWQSYFKQQSTDQPINQ